MDILGSFVKLQCGFVVNSTTVPAGMALVDSGPRHVSVDVQKAEVLLERGSIVFEIHDAKA